MASTIVVPAIDVIIEQKVIDAFTAASTDIAALQAGTTAVNTQVAAGSSLTMSAATHNGKIIALDTASGSTCTLPASTGSGSVYRFRVSVLATSNSHIVKVANSTDVMTGLVFGTRVDTGNAVLGFATAAASDTITLNRTTTGSVSLGEWIECRDVASGFYQVSGFLSSTGAAFATPFSSGV